MCVRRLLISGSKVRVLDGPPLTSGSSSAAVGDGPLLVLLPVAFFFRHCFWCVTAKEAPMSCLRWLVLIAIATSISAHSASQARAATATVVIAQGVDPTTLDPMNHQEAPATVLANNLFDGLIERDPDLNLVPLLAESYQSAGPTIWEFKL